MFFSPLNSSFLKT